MSRLHRWLAFGVCSFVLVAAVAPSRATEPVAGKALPRRDGNRLTYLDENNPYYPHRDFPKLITPQWVGDEGVECVVVLAIDDMRDPAKYEAYLRPILNRLKQIDGRAPVSIMTNSVKPDDPQLQQWLGEGLSIEVHTADHPCPLLQGGDLAKAKSTYDRCVDQMFEIPGNRPVAFRMPCCDSLNTVSPRFYSEIFNGTTPKGHSLAISSSVFNLFTPNDPAIPRELLYDPDGRDKFRKYIPKGNVRNGQSFNTFVNYIEDYPYPYVINRLCWEFPCVVPSDWSAQHLQKPFNPDTVRDLKAALDICVLKQGVFNLVFHPHGWIKAEQVVQLIDHAVAKHGNRVKFLNFREALERLNKNLLKEIPLRAKSGAGPFARLLDLNDDDYVDVLFSTPMELLYEKPAIRTWNRQTVKWQDEEYRKSATVPDRDYGFLPRSVGIFGSESSLGLINQTSQWNWVTFPIRDSKVLDYFSSPNYSSRSHFVHSLRDLDRDGQTELLLFANPSTKSAEDLVLEWSDIEKNWKPLPFRYPPKVRAYDEELGTDAGLRFVDIDEDGHEDIVFSNHERYGVYLFENMQTGWSRVALEGTRSVPEASGGRRPPEGSNAENASDPKVSTPVEATGKGATARGEVERRPTPPPQPSPRKGGREQSLVGEGGLPESNLVLPPIVRVDGSDNGFFVHSRSLFWQNEDTDKLLDLVDRRSFNEILAQADLPPTAKSPEASLNSIKTLPGFKVELMAAEPLVRDPIAFAFGADGKLWVAEMGDYPLGKSTPGGGAALAKEEKRDAGGRIRFLEDTDGDGKYDKSTVFLDVAYPTGVLPWKKGILVSAAPDVFYAEDTDGDGKADKREVLFTGFKEGNQQHRVNGLVRGLDNWIYLANGDSGGTVRYVGPASGGRQPPEGSKRQLNAGRGNKRPARDANANGEPGAAQPPLPGLPPARGGGRSGARGRESSVEIGGRDVRIRPDTGEIEAIAGQTQFGRNRDDAGNWFGCNNSNPMYQFVLDDHYQRRNPNFAAPIGRVDVPEIAGNAPVFPISQLLARFNDFHTANRFTSACSAMIYRDDLFGPAFAGSMFVSEPVHNLVHHEVVTPQGATFRSRRSPDELQSEFLASSDNWFRPTMIQTGPDGALWIADMYRHVIEHPEWIPADWQARLDLQAGWDKGRLYRVYPVDKAPRPIPRLDKLDTAGLVAALDSPGGWQRDMAQQLLIERFGPASPSPHKPREIAECVLRLEKLARECARPLGRLHALCTLGGIDHPSTSLLLHTLSDKSPVVRRHAIRLCEEITEPPAEMITALVGLAADADPHVRMQLAYTLGELSDSRAGAALGTLLTESADDQFLFAAAMSSLNRHNINSVLTAVLNRGEKQPLNTNLIESLLNQAVALGNDKAFQTLLATVAEPKDGRFATWQLSAVAALLDTLERKQQSLAELPKSADDRETPVARLQRLFAFARTLAADPSATGADRIAAIRLLGRGVEQPEEERQLLASFLTAQTAPDLQAAAVATLGRLSDPGIAESLLSMWRTYGPARRLQVLDVLLSREAWTERLLNAIGAGDVAPADIDAARRQRLVTHSSNAIREQAAKLLAGTINSDRQKVVDEYRKALMLTADRQRGAQVFAKTCAQCHRLQGVGHEVGPDLASLTDKSPEALLVAVLDPNRAVEAKFINYTAITSAGRSFTGLLAAETGNSITLRGPEAKEETVLRSELDELVSTSKSAMPEGLEKDLAPQDLADVIAHIRANVPLPKRKEFSGNEPALVKANAEGILKLSARNCEIYGTTLVFEPQYSNLGYWTSLDDHAVWTIDSPAAGKFKVEFVWACDESNAGSTWRLEGAAGSLTGEVSSTGNWDTYQEAVVGEITLSKGEQRLTLRPAEKPMGAMLDLKVIRLRGLGD